MENQFQVDYRSKHKNVDENNRAFEVKKKKKPIWPWPKKKIS